MALRSRRTAPKEAVKLSLDDARKQLASAYHDGLRKVPVPLVGPEYKVRDMPMWESMAVVAMTVACIGSGVLHSTARRDSARAHASVMVIVV
jgi:hypothetical protein